MRFTLIGQACLLVENGPDQLLVDPWLVGSCYWRSWWHYPPARPELIDPERVSAIYITHEHPDHLHFPSLRRFPRGVRVLVPRFPVDRLAPFLRERGFTHVEELPHGGRARVGSLALSSYQAGSDDSIALITDGRTTLFDMNDAKAAGRALGQILERHPRPDFFLRSHSPAQAFPFCYTADEPRELEVLPARRALARARRLLARAAVPAERAAARDPGQDGALRRGPLSAATLLGLSRRGSRARSWPTHLQRPCRLNRRTPRRMLGSFR